MTVGKRIPFLVVGGGIGGLVSALALSRHGYRVHVLERAEAFAEIGAGLQLAPNASRVLDRLGILDEVTKDAFFPSRLVLMDAVSGGEITALETGDEFVRRYGYPYFVTHRADLLQALLTACQQSDRVTLEASKEVVDVKQRDDGVTVVCADGSVYDADALVGADGLKSAVRAALLPTDPEPVCSAYVAFRGTVPMEEMSAVAGLKELRDMVIWTGPGMHLVQYPVRRGELCNLVAVFHSAQYRPDSDDWGTAEELDAVFAQACPHVQDSIRVIGRGRRWPLYDRLPGDNWTHGRATLLGDAAHPMLQYLAQGANQALEDAVVLADSVAVHGDDAVEQAFKAYQESRYPRTARVQTSARKFGEILHIDGMGAELRTALLRRRAHDDYTETDWLYAYDATASQGSVGPDAEALGA